MNEPTKLKVIFSKQGAEKARSLSEEEVKAIDYFSQMYVKALNEIYILNEHEKQHQPQNPMKND